MASSDGSIILETKVDDSGLSSGMSKLKSGVTKFGKAFAAVGTAATAAFVAISKSAVESYAEYEQLVGGVETLFKTSSDVVMNYASQAYETAGMSANAYMETVTGFSASLLQSLGGDTAKAAEYGNQAVIDMSDNANKMGTSIEAIQNAYQGFAKQNYTMLDNLKLGYGGTKTEMERLLKDAENFKKANGEMASYSIDSFADIVEAIHVVQENMGITGTTATEASTTIQGSIGMMKGAWENLLTGMADPSQDMGALIDKFVQSIVTVGQNLIPVIQNVVQGIFNVIQGLLPMIEPFIQQLLPIFVDGAIMIVQGVVQVLPSIITAITSLFPQVIDALLGAADEIIGALPQIITVIVTALPTLIPTLIDGVVSAVMMLVEMFPEIIQPIIENLPEIITSITGALIENLPILIEGCVQLVIGIVAALPQIITSLLQAIGVIAVQIGKELFEALPGPVQNAFSSAWEAVKAVWDLASPYFKMIWDNIKAVFSVVKEVLGAAFKTAWTEIKAVWNTATSYFSAVWNSIAGVFDVVQAILSGDFQGAWEAIKGIVGTWASFFSGVWNNIKSVYSSVGSFFKTCFTSAWNGIKQVFSNVGQFFSTVWQNIKNAFKFTEMKSIGTNIVQGLWNGINDMTAWITGKIKSFCSNALQAIKDFFGIHSPATTTIYVGEMLVAGMAIGIEESSDMVTEAFKSLTNDTRSEVQKLLDEWEEDEKDVLWIEQRYADESLRIEKDREEKEWQSKIDSAKKTLEEEKKSAETTEKIREAEAKYEEKIQELHNERMEKEQKEAEDKYLAQLKQNAEKVRKIVEAERKDAENLKNSIIQAYNDISSAAIDDIEQLEKTQESFAQKLKDYGSLTTEKELMNGKKITVAANLDKQVKFLESYEKSLLKIKEMENVPTEFFEMIRDMSVEEGADYANALLNLSEKDFQKYISDWKRKQEVSQRISKEMYKDEASQLATEINDKFDAVEEEFFGVGETAADNFESGFMDELKAVITNIKSAINGAFANVAIPVTSLQSSGIVTQSATLNVPALASGGIVPRAMTALIGERGKEAVLPLENNTEWMDILADKVAQRNKGQNNQVIREEHYNLNRTELMTILYKLVKGGERLNGTSFVNGGAY